MLFNNHRRLLMTSDLKNRQLLMNVSLFFRVVYEPIYKSAFYINGKAMGAKYILNQIITINTHNGVFTNLYFDYKMTGCPDLCRFRYV